MSCGAPSITAATLGTGVFVRRISDWPIDVLSRFGWACVAVRASRGRALNRDSSWWCAACEAGVVLTAMDWLPTPQHWGTRLECAIAWSADHGSACWVVDPEIEWVGETTAAQRYVDAARYAADRALCGLGLTTYSHPPKRWPAHVWVPGCADLTVPQTYDRYGRYTPDYAAEAVEDYRALGAKRLAVGRGAFVDPDGVGPSRARWRTPGEIERHRATTPPIAGDVVGTCWWPPWGRAPKRVVDAIVRG